MHRWLGRGSCLQTDEHPDNLPLPGSMIIRYHAWAYHVIIPLPKVNQASKSSGLNRGPDHILIPKYQVKPLAHSGTKNVPDLGPVKREFCLKRMTR